MTDCAAFCKDKLSERSECVIKKCCTAICEGTFDTKTVERFLIHVRESLPADTWLREFADFMAHSVRDRGKGFEFSQTAVEYFKNRLWRTSIGEQTKDTELISGAEGVNNETIREELSKLLEFWGFMPVNMETTYDFLFCVATILNQAKFKIDSCTTAHAMLLVVNDSIAVDIGNKDGQGIFLKIPNRYYPRSDAFVDCSSHNVEAVRNENNRLELDFPFGRPMEYPNSRGFGLA